VIGGIATMGGPFIGPLVMVAIPELLQVVPGLKTLIYGIILLLFIIFMPSGIVGGLKRSISRISVLGTLKKLKDEHQMPLLEVSGLTKLLVD